MRRLVARAAVGVVLLGVLAGVSGCAVTADVAVREGVGGAGTVTVTVTLDAGADAEIGGLASQLDTAGLAGEGWAVGPVVPTAAGGASVRASHPYADQAQLQDVLDEVVAGSATDHPLTLTLGSTRQFLYRGATASGAIDLDCGVACFGDSGLAAVTGSPVGVEPSAVERSTGTSAAQALHLDLSVALPGRIGRNDATGRSGSVLVWRGRLGATVPVDASSTVADHRRAAAQALVAAVGVVLVLAVGATLWWGRRRRGRRRLGAGVGGVGGAGGGGAGG